MANQYFVMRSSSQIPVYVFHGMCSNTERVTVIRNQNKFGFYLVTFVESFNKLVNALP